MGDRANIVVRETWDSNLDDKEAVFLYTHWAGSELPETLRRGLSAARGRWDDSPYLARILFQTMLGGDDGTAGYGISTRLTDNSYNLLVLTGERVYLLDEESYNVSGFATLPDSPSCSFDEVCDLETDELTWESLARIATIVNA